MLSKSEIKYIQSLSQKKFREAEGCFIVEGPKIVQEMISVETGNCPALPRPEKIYATREWISAHSGLTRSIPVTQVEPFELQKISQLTTPNEVLAIVQKTAGVEPMAGNEALTLALDGIQDPGNLGTIIRIADWFGITQIVCSPDCADAYSSKVVQATMGSIFRVNMFYTALPQWLKKQKGTGILGAVLQGTPLKQLAKMQGGVLAIGNESKGLSPEVMDCISQRITIERVGAAESLNAAVATGIILSHLI